MSMFAFGRCLLHYLAKGGIRHLILHVTSHCNLRCPHCFVEFDRQNEMKLDEFQRIARDIGPLFWLDIGGGEPSLRNDLADIVAAFAARVVQIPSNGMLPDQLIGQLDRLSTMTKAEVTVSLSLDGLQETHNRIRSTPNGWNQVWATFDLVKQRGLAVKINTVLTKDNADEILPLMREVKARGADFHSIIPLRGEPRDPNAGLPDMAILQHLLPDILNELSSYTYAQNPLAAHILKNYHRYMWRLTMRILKERRQVVPCLAGQAHWVVYSDGQVAPCEMLPPIGSLRNHAWHDVISSPPATDQIAGIRGNMCYCTHNCALLDSILFNPRSLPALLLKP